MTELRDVNPYRQGHGVRRVTLSLPASLAAWVRAEAQRFDVPISWVIERAIRDERDRAAPPESGDRE